MITGVDDTVLIEGELVLAEHAELVRPDHGALLGRDSPVRSFMNVDLPEPFGPERP
jgi:hypothetical protein